jgi:hypothetical protein
MHAAIQPQDGAPRHDWTVVGVVFGGVRGNGVETADSYACVGGGRHRLNARARMRPPSPAWRACGAMRVGSRHPPSCPPPTFTCSVLRPFLQCDARSDAHGRPRGVRIHLDAGMQWADWNETGASRAPSSPKPRACLQSMVRHAPDDGKTCALLARCVGRPPGTRMPSGHQPGAGAAPCTQNVARARASPMPLPVSWPLHVSVIPAYYRLQYLSYKYKSWCGTGYRSNGGKCLSCDCPRRGRCAAPGRSPRIESNS